ncbi:DNA-processing protein DprA [bacterium]|nr:DNA-processing protein DprA [bacterium]
MNDLDLMYWLALTQVKGVGPARFFRLIELYGSPKAVFEKRDELLDKTLPAELLTSIKNFAFDPIKRLIEQTRTLGIHIVTFNDEQYPKALQHIAQAPPVLYFKGDLTFLNEGDWLGVVGSREITDYGVKVCRELVRDLVLQGVRIASGFAAGVDIEAHLTCLYQKGKTVGVLGHGLDVMFPSDHKKYVGPLLDNGGALLSEFPIGSEIHPGFFPRRNRIISGLSRGVLVVEANAKSGSLITADYALEEGRDVFAVPGPIFSARSAGCNQLIQKGAKLVTKAQDILDEWKYEVRTLAPRHHFENPEEEVIFKLLGEHILDMDDIIVKTTMPAHTVSRLLTKMEMEGRIRAMPGRRFHAVS